VQKRQVFPLTTWVQNPPVTLYQEISAKAFEYPFFDEGVMATRTGEIFFDCQNIRPDRGEDLLEVTGFIFHTSHCGSTLLSRMLGSLPSVRVVSETEAINGLLLSYFLYGLEETFVKERLQKIIDLYRRPLPGEKRLIFKLTSWNVFLIPFFLEIYPNTKWVYIDRNTEDTVSSLMRSGGGFADWWHHPTAVLTKQFLPLPASYPNQEDYLRAMIDRHRFFAKKHMNARGDWLEYPGFLEQYDDRILPHFNLEISSEEMTRSRKLLKNDAKSMEKTLFFKDRDEKESIGPVK
jgi:hypothetical protein